MAIKIWEDVIKDDGSMYIRLVSGTVFGDNVLAVVDFEGDVVNGGYMLSVTADGIVRHEAFNFDGDINIKTKNGYVKQTKD